MEFKESVIQRIKDVTEELRRIDPDDLKYRQGYIQAFEDTLEFLKGGSL